MYVSNDTCVLSYLSIYTALAYEQNLDRGLLSQGNYLQSDSNLICRYPDIGSIYICFIWQNISYVESTGVLIKKIMFYQYWKIPFWSKAFAHLYDVYCLDMYTMHKPIYSILGCIMWMDKNLHITPPPPPPPQIARLMGPTWGPPGSCWSQMGPMLAPWTLLSGSSYVLTGDSSGAVIQYVHVWFAMHTHLLVITLLRGVAMGKFVISGMNKTLDKYTQRHGDSHVDSSVIGLSTCCVTFASLHTYQSITFWNTHLDNIYIHLVCTKTKAYIHM